MTDKPASETYTVPQVLERALGEHRAGRLAGAQRLYRKILRNVPAHPDAMHLLGLSEHHRGEHAKGVRMVERALGQRPDVAAYHNTLADCYRWLGQPEPAINHYREAIRLAPEAARPHYNLAVACREGGRNAEADAALQRAVELDPALERPRGGAEDRGERLRQAVEVSRRAASMEITQQLGRLGGGDGPLEIEGREGANVVGLEGLHLPPGQVLTLRGGSRDVFVLNVRTHFALDEDARVELAGGLAPNQVLWNCPAQGEGPGAEIRGGPGSVLHGTLLAPDWIVFWFGTVHGGLIAAANAGGPATVEVIPFAPRGGPAVPPPVAPPPPVPPAAPTPPTAPPPATAPPGPPRPAAPPSPPADAVDALLGTSDEDFIDQLDDFFADLGGEDELKRGTDEGIRTWAADEQKAKRKRKGPRS